MPDPHPTVLEQRIMELETLFTHLQHDVQQLNQVILEQQKQLDALHKKNEQLLQHIEELEKPEERDPLQERPPHY
ncbi:MAG: SlyX family protein [Planctomycetaceae bacterium]|nr:SlyX family protein [Planctomycetaceae bacterium]